ncbi:MAG: hypothetical protein IJ938_05630 [Clostridia bacterium]|nr:hypothetical protein [Clostridia bacterium]
MEQYTFNTSMAYIEEKEEDEESFAHEEKPSLEGEKVVLGGILKGLRKVLTKDQKTMKYGQIEDLFGNIDVVFFPKVYEKARDLIEDDMVVEIKGTLALKH